MDQNVKILTIGNLDKLPDYARKAMLKAMEMTRDNTGLTLNVALSYGGRQELVDSFKKLALQIKQGLIDADEIDEQLVAQNLYTANQPDPDLVIRTGGERRISNFLLWQIAYAEIYFTRTAWPDFRKPQFVDAIWDYARRERRFGMVSEQLNKETILQNV